MSTEALDQAAATSAPQLPTTVWNAGFLSIFFTNMALNMGMFMSNSLLSIYANSLGASATAIGMVMSTFAISSISFRMISAPIMDTYNRKYVVAFATSTLAIAFFGFSLANSIPVLLAFRLVQGCGMAFGNACCLAIVAEMLPKDKYASGIGYYSLAQVMCQAIGPSLGLFLVDQVGFKMTYIFNSCVMLIATFLALRVKLNFTQTKKLTLRINNIIAKEALLPSSTLLILSMGGTAIGSFLILFSREQGVTSNIGLYYTVTAVTMLATRPMIGKLTDKYGLVKVIVPALLCNVATFFIISFSTTLWGFLLAGLISAFGYGACQPAMQALTMKAVTNDRRGAASSTNYIGMDLGSLFGPTLCGAVAQSLGYVMMWRVMTIPFIIGMIYIFLSRSTIKQIEDEFEARQSA
ncbi:MAG: MFS transporter [Clostridiales bacterium]|nr:MFS transporter [Clostridiales bacterium]